MNILCHCHPDRFWKVLLRQGVDFLKIDKKWYGLVNPEQTEEDCIESSFCMLLQIQKTATCYLGSPQIFTGYADEILKYTYRALGQILVLDIFSIDNDPECLHNALVNKLFGISDTFELEDLHSFDGELGRKIEKPKVRNNECLLEANIMPINDIQENI